MQNAGPIVRSAARADAEEIFSVLNSAFHLEENAEKGRRMRDLALGSTERFLVLERQGRVVGTALLSPQWLRVGTAQVLKGDVGEVGVRRELQGLGLGTALMAGCVRLMREQGYHLSRLGGLNRFYARFGYVPFPRRYYEFPLADARAGASVIPAARIVTVPSGQEAFVRHYEPHRDALRRGELYDRFNEHRTGSRVEERPAVPPPAVSAAAPRTAPDRRSLRFVYERDDVVWGYLFASEYAEEPSPFEARVTIHEAAFDPARPEALTTLLRFTLREALHRGAHRVTARLPFDPVIQQLLTEAALPFSLQELQSAPASNMLLLVDLPGLLRAIAPELARRQGNAPMCSPFRLRLRAGDQAATVALGGASVTMTAAEPADASLDCDVATWLRWTLGLNGFAEWRAGVRHSLNAEQSRLLAALFPREACASGPWG
jgi:predicted N-acetyltransferase YhbS